MCMERVSGKGASIRKGPGVGVSLAFLKSERNFSWSWSKMLWGL